MYPWLWFWAPHIEFPLSGDVTQDIEPIVALFKGAMGPDAGHPQIEQKAFEKASYGKQLGLITEVLISVAEKMLPEGGKQNNSLKELKRIRDEIEKIKEAEYDAEFRQTERRVVAISKRGGARARALKNAMEGTPDGGA